MLRYVFNTKFLHRVIFFRTVDGLIRNGTLENSDKNGLLTVSKRYKRDERKRTSVMYFHGEKLMA
jgi:hypothetical protein